MSRLFPLRPKRSKPGWVALCPAAGSPAAVHVLAGGQGRARVLWVESLTTGMDEMERLARSRGLSAYRITTLMPPGSYQLLQMNAPAVPRHEWKEALRWQLKDFIDFPAEQATFDVLDIPTESHAPGRPHMVFVAVARNEQVGEIMARYDRAHLNLQAIDIPELALRNVAALLEDENRGLASLSFDQHGGLLVLTFKGELYASRRIEIPLEQFTGADLERRQTLFERVGLELQRTLDAFDRQYSFISVSRLLLAPRPELSGLLDYLGSSLYVPVDQMDLSQVLDLEACPTLQQPAEQSRHLLALGAALRQESQP